MSDILHVGDDVYDASFAIGGLSFQPNLTTALRPQEGWFTLKVGSSPGPLISDFVTHGPRFEYTTLGIHVGQDDRLTFFGDKEGKIIADFVDCRRGSPTLHQRLRLSYAPSPFRRLVIPRGVAHTFDGLAGVVTRDEPVWYSAVNNPHWNVNNDLISVLRTASEFPVVETNEFMLPDSIHEYMTRLSQAVLQEPKAYSTRFLLRIAGEEQYVMFQENTWDNEGRALQPLMEEVQSPYLSAVRSKYAITGIASWTLVPNTDAGIADVLYLPPDTQKSAAEMFVHRRTRHWYTFLTNERSPLRIAVLDLRSESPTFGGYKTFSTSCDPRVSFAIEPGVAYRFSTQSGAFVRSEHEVFVDAEEPRSDLPPFGADFEVVNRHAYSPHQPKLPTLKCPSGVIRQMARFEQEAH